MAEGETSRALHNGSLASKAIGKPPRLDRVEISKHRSDKYRVNIWEQPAQDADVLPGLQASEGGVQEAGGRAADMRRRVGSGL